MLTEPMQRRLFVPLVAAALLVMAALSLLDGRLRTEAAPLGIVSFELAGDVQAAAAMVTAWDVEARVAAGFSLGLDYLFLLLYPASIALACVLVARRLRGLWPALAAAGAWLAWAQLAAGLLDAVENYALLRLLLAPPEAPWPAVAWACAVPKFALVALGLLYAALGALVTVRKARRA
jgi:hypothetical protein